MEAILASWTSVALGGERRQSGDSAKAISPTKHEIECAAALTSALSSQDALKAKASRSVRPSTDIVGRAAVEGWSAGTGQAAFNVPPSLPSNS